VDLINKEFPHIHVVKGKPRKPTTQGSVEVSHKAFKEALTVWCNETGSQDWVYGSYIVQNKVNQRPMRSRGNISPHTLNYVMNFGDVLLAVDGLDVEGMKLPEIMNILKGKQTNIVTLTFLNKEWFNNYDRDSVKTGTIIQRKR